MPKTWLFVTGAMILVALAPEGQVEGLLPVKCLVAFICLMFSLKFLMAGVFTPMTIEQVRLPTMQVERPSWLVEPTLFAIFGLWLTIAMTRLADKKALRTQATLLCVCGLLVAGMALTQRINLFQWIVIDWGAVGSASSRMIGPFGNHMLTGNYLAIIAPLFLMFPKRYWGGWLVCVVTILLTGNKAGLLSLSLGLMAWFMLKRMWFSAILLILGSVYAVITHLNVDDGGRLVMWNGIYTLWKQTHQVYFGTGLGWIHNTFMHIGNQLVGSNFFSAHNDWLTVLVELGMVGAAIVLWGIGNLGYRIFLSDKTPELCAYASSLIATIPILTFGFPIRIAPLVLVLITAWSATTWLSNEN